MNPGFAKVFAYSRSLLSLSICSIRKEQTAYCFQLVAPYSQYRVKINPTSSLVDCDCLEFIRGADRGQLCWHVLLIAHSENLLPFLGKYSSSKLSEHFARFQQYTKRIVGKPNETYNKRRGNGNTKRQGLRIWDRGGLFKRRGINRTGLPIVCTVCSTCQILFFNLCSLFAGGKLACF